MSGRHLHVVNVIEDGKLAGPQARIAQVAARLKSRLRTTVVMPLANSARFRERCRRLGVEYSALPLSHITKQLGEAFRYVLCWPFEVVALTRFLIRSRVDVVHVSGGAWQFKGVIAARLACVKCVWHLNDTSMPGFIRHTFRLLSGLATGFIYASEASRAYYGPLVNRKKPCFVIPAPVDTVQLDPERATDEDDLIVGSWGDDVVIGMVANISPVKGLETFIRTAAAASMKRDNLQFVVAGPVSRRQQPYYERLQALCGDLGVTNVEFVGGRDDVRPLLKRFDIYLCTSTAESSPMAVWEAMAMEKPVVSTDVGDVSLYVRPGSNGFVEEVADWQALATDVLELAGNEAKRREYGRICRRVAIQELDVQHCADLHYKAYQKLVSGEAIAEPGNPNEVTK